MNLPRRLREIRHAAPQIFVQVHVWLGQWAKMTVATWSESIDSPIRRAKSRNVSRLAASRGSRTRASMALPSWPSHCVLGLGAQGKMSVIEREVQSTFETQLGEDLRQQRAQSVAPPSIDIRTPAEQAFAPGRSFFQIGHDVLGRQ